MRGAVSLDVIRSLVDQGARVRAYDPQASEAARQLLPASVLVADSPDAAAEGAGALVLLTEWPEFADADWRWMSAQMGPPKFLFDSRNALDPARMSRLGFEYMGVGRPNTGHPVQQAPGKDGAIKGP